MKRRLSIRPEAQQDIKDAISWYEGRERGLGARFKAEVRTALRRIGDNALMFPKIDDNVRRALLQSFPYSVYFIVESRVVVILAILHQHRHPASWATRS
jgi:plasmid stabilization system protein ParE